jgi:hypothetical protein
MMKTLKLSLFVGCLLSLTTWSFGQNAQYQKYYNSTAGSNAPQVAERDDRGEVKKNEKGEIIYKEVAKDAYGNAQGNQYDLAVDGAFDGQTILVLQLYSEPSFNFEAPEKALKEKGFGLFRYINNPPDAQQLKKDLTKSCQLWIISDSYSKLNDDHLKVIKEFFDDGHGIYIWGDNDPYYADANKVADYLFGGQMTGNLMGDTPVGIQIDSLSPGIKAGHLVTTGLENVYEGITIATVSPNPYLQPIIYGSAGNLVTAVYEHDGKRAILDGGFTRLYYKWETAGTDRYVKNAAAWLVNFENLAVNH